MKRPPVKAAPGTSPILTPGLRRYLYFTAAVTGGSIMIVEILGAKMLAPYIGTSHFVWTAQIAVTLLALSVGYYAGGRLVDRSQSLARLYGFILGAALYLGLTILFVQPVAFGCLNFNLAVGSLLASAFLFFVPLALLAMVGPFFVRVLTVAVPGVGGNVGRLTAISTLGSVIGTLLIGYLFIPRFPNSVTMYLTSGVLAIVAAVYFLVFWKKQTALATTAVIIFALAPGALGVAWDRSARGNGWHEIARANSNFGRLQVIDTDSGKSRYLLDDFIIMDMYNPPTKQSSAAFTYLLHSLARDYTAHIESVLCIGLGAGIAPMQFANDGAKVDVVEINPAMVPIAARYFDFEPARVNLTFDDGRRFINRCTKKYDAIILDAFLGDSSPSHLMTREAFAAMQRHLNADGVLVINTIGGLQPGKDFLIASVDDTLKSVFSQVRLHVAGDQEFVNVLFVASDQRTMSLKKPSAFVASPILRQEIQDAYLLPSPAIDSRHGQVLTDDFNPVEYYDAANCELMRRQAVALMRN